MKLFKLPIILCVIVLLSIVSACGAEKTKDPITFKMSWNNQSEIVTFE